MNIRDQIKQFIEGNKPVPPALAYELMQSYESQIRSLERRNNLPKDEIEETMNKAIDNAG